MVDRLFEGDPMQKIFLQKRLEEAKQTGLQFGLTKGEQIGLTKGQHQTHIHNIKKTLTIDFAIKTEGYDARLDKLPLPQLERLSREALLVKQVVDFDSLLNPMLTD